MILQGFVNPLLALLLSAGLFGAGCSRQAEGTGGEEDGPASAVRLASAPYDFERPAAVHTLPVELNEISGITMVDERHAAAVQDEVGDLFFIDVESGRVVRRLPFGKDRDYEDVALVGDRLFALRSDGNLYELLDWRAGPIRVVTHKTFLSAENDTEGLAYDAGNQRLLIVCKEFPGTGLGEARAVYAFDLAQGALGEAPVFVLSFDTLATHLRARRPQTLAAKARALLEGDALYGFKPAGAAVHPLTGELYLVSSVTKWIVVLGADGALRAVYRLPEQSFAQPEGIAFLPDGDLLISNEAAGGRPNLIRFNYQSTYEGR